VKIRVPILGTVGKAVMFDPEAGARAEAAVAALAAQISAGIGSTIFHRNLLGLQVGNDHPQYTGWQFPQTIVGQWNFQTIPFIQGNTLAEYIEDVVGGSFFDFLQDTTSVVWTFFDTANELEANVPPEFVQDTVGAMLVDSTSIDFTYTDGGPGLGTFTAATINANPSGLIGMTAVNGTAATPLRSDGRHAIDPVIAPTWTGEHRFQADTFFGNGTDPRVDFDAATVARMNFITASASADSRRWRFLAVAGEFFFQAMNDAESVANSFLHFTRSSATPLTVQIPLDNLELQIGAGQDLRLFHDGTDSWVRNDTGILKLSSGATSVFEVTAARGTFNVPFRSKAYTVATLPTGAQGDRAHVTDALAPVFLGIIAGGGAVVTPVFHNGTNWVAD
jgi:hypothetical protein